MHVLSRSRGAVTLSALVIAAVLTLAGCAAPAASHTQGGPSPVAGAAPSTTQRGQGEIPAGGVATFISAGRIDMPGVPVPPGAETRMTAAQQVQVARALLIPYLDQFRRPEVPAGLRLRDYRLSDNDIHLIQGPFSPLVFSVRFAVLPEDPNAPGWLAGSGTPQPDGWIQNEALIMTVVAKEGAYRIQSVDPYLADVGTKDGAVSQGDGSGEDKDETTPERYVLGLFKGDKTSDADARLIITTLPKLNWSVYEKESGGRTMELLQWLDNRQIDGVTEITCVLRGTTGLDAAFAERYTRVVGTLLSADPVQFLRALSALPEDQADQICSFVGFHSTESDMASAKEQLRRLRSSPDLTVQEKGLADALISAMDSPWR